MIESFKLPVITPETLTGSICSFNDEYGGLPLKSCTSLISGYQEGTGTPSPDNVRPLVSFSSANIVNVSNYGSWFRGIYHGVYGFVDLGSLEWTSTERYFRADLPITPKTVNDRETPNAITDSQYQPIDFYSLYNNYGSYDDVFAVTNGTAGSNKFYIRDTSYSDADTFKTAMSGVYLIYELATPTTPTITPEQFATLCQAFGITGNTYTFTFGQSIYQGYIDWERGVVVGNMSFVNLGFLNWSLNDTTSTYNDFRSLDLQNIIKNGVDTRVSNIYCELFNPVARNGQSSYVNSISVSILGRLIVYADNSSYPDKTSFETAISNKYLAYELATPIEIPLGGINLLTQEGQNNIYCNTGNIEVTYLKVN